MKKIALNKIKKDCIKSIKKIALNRWKEMHQINKKNCIDKEMRLHWIKKIRLNKDVLLISDVKLPWIKLKIIMIEFCHKRAAILNNKESSQKQGISFLKQ